LRTDGGILLFIDSLPLLFVVMLAAVSAIVYLISWSVLYGDERPITRLDEAKCGS